MRFAEYFITFRNKFQKINNTGARILDSIYHMTSKLLKNYIFGTITSRFDHVLRNVIMYIMLCNVTVYN